MVRFSKILDIIASPKLSQQVDWVGSKSYPGAIESCGEKEMCGIRGVRDQRCARLEMCETRD